LARRGERNDGHGRQSPEDEEMQGTYDQNIRKKVPGIVGQPVGRKRASESAFPLDFKFSSVVKVPSLSMDSNASRVTISRAKNRRVMTPRVTQSAPEETVFRATLLKKKTSVPDIPISMSPPRPHSIVPHFAIPTKAISTRELGVTRIRGIVGPSASQGRSDLISERWKLVGVDIRREIKISQRRHGNEMVHDMF
jgi:hypothetical protein